MEKTIKKPGILAALLVAFAGISGLLLPPALLLTGGLFGYLLTAGGVFPFLLSVSLLAGAAFALSGIDSLWLFSLMLPAALCMFIMLRRKAAYFDTALAVASLYAATLYLMFSMPDLLSGAPAFYTVQQTVVTLWNESIAIWSQTPGALTADQIALLGQMGKEIAAQLPIYMPAGICGAGAVMGLTNLLICRRLSHRANAPIKPMRPFLFWQLPQSFLYGMLTMAAGILVASSIGISAMDAIMAAAFIVALIPFAVQGMSVLWFMHRARRSGFVSLTFLVVMLVLTFPLSVVSLGLVGLLEQLLHLRRKYLQREQDKQDQ